MMPEWTFTPWNLGADVRWNGQRLLLLGESQYDDGQTPERDQAVIAQSTIQSVRDWSLSANLRYQRFFPYLYETVTGERWESGSPRVAAFWRSIYFYNYVQQFVGDGPRQRPTAAMFRTSEPAFHAALAAIRPDAILVLGRALWRSMAESDDPGPNLEGGLGQTYWFATEGGSKALAAHIRHPSSVGFSPAEWSSKVLAFLEASRRLNRR
jgi:hypothetical protein